MQPNLYVCSVALTKPKSPNQCDMNCALKLAFCRVASHPEIAVNIFF